MGSYQQVLRFDVSVHDVEAVEVFNGVGQVVKHATGIPFCVPGG